MLAIIIPYYKLTFFDATLQSLANQTDKRFKVYIGDDASPEGPITLLENFKGQIEFIYYRFEINLGGISLAKQWERCIDMIEDEEWIMILGDDDYLDKNVIKTWYEHFDIFNNKSKVIRFSQQIIYQEFNKMEKIVINPKWESAKNSYFRKYSGLSSSSLSEYIFLKESYVKYGFVDYPLGWNSDDNAWLDFSDGLPIYSINESIVNVRISSINISGKKDNMEYKNASKVKFYKNIISKNKYCYNKNQILAIIIGLESEIKKVRPLYFIEWLYLLKLYLIYFHPISLIKFYRRFFLSLFKKE